MVFSFLSGAGAMRASLAGCDWDESPVGRPETWSLALKAALSMILPSKAEIALLWGPDYVAFYNDAYAPTIGAKHPRALGRPAREVWSELWDDLEPLLDRVFKRGETVSARDRPFYIERQGQGETVYFDISYSPVREADGRMGGVLCIVAETTARVLAARQLASERQRIAQMFEQTPGFMALLEGPYHVFTLANPAYRRLTGERPLIGLSVSEALPEAVGQGFVDLLDSVYASGETFRGRSLSVRLQQGPTTEQRWLDFVYQPIRDAGGAVTGIFVEGFDVTEAARSAEELRASEARFRSFAQAIPSHLWTATPDGRLDWFNDEVYRFTGAEPGTLDGMNWAALIHPEDLAPTMAIWAQALREAGVYETEFRIRRHDGAYRWHLVRAVPVRGEAGEVTRWVGANTDIQDQKDVSATLESRVAERSRQLVEAQEALRQSQKMEAIGQLTGGVAHDFNNLLQTISGALDRVRHRIAKGRFDDVERFLKAAEEGAGRAAALTHRLLAFSRRQTLAPRALDLNRLVLDMEDLIRRSMGPSIRLEVALSPGLWTIRADAGQLENALLNLCINARDAMPSGGSLVIETLNRRLEASGDRAAGDYVALCVDDDGVGMAQAVRERAFEPFFTTKPLGQGTGLGLSMIYGFVRQSGGEARIASEVGAGTRVTLDFPRHFGAAEALEETPPPAQHSGAGETVLVVDDEDSVRELVVELLTENGYRALAARDGRSALAILARPEAVDLLITDVGLPGGMNGRQVADAARARLPALRVLFITGYAETAALDGADLGPGMAVMAKPFALGALGAKVREMLAGREATV